MKLNNIFVGATLMLLTYAFSVKAAMADSYIQTSDKYNVTIDKKIRPINDISFYDNIPASQKTFFERDQIEFELIVNNTGSQVLTDLIVKDTLPKSFTPQLYFGTYDANTGVIQVKLANLAVGESKIYNIRGMLTNLPASDFANQLVKYTNRADVYNTVASDTDFASYFAEKRVNPVTGAESMVLGSIVSMLSLGAAFGVRKAIRGY